MNPIGTKAMLELTTLFTAGGKGMSCAFHFEHDEGLTMTAPMLTAICSDFHLQFGPLWAPFCSVDSTCVGVKGVYVKDTTYVDAYGSSGSTGGDLDLPDDAPGQMGDDIALVLQKRTGERGRSNRGRWFIPGLHEGANNHGFFNATTYGDAAVDLTAFLGADFVVGAGAGVAGTVWHPRLYKPGKAATDDAPAVAPDFKPIVDVRWVNKLSTRKDRRIPGLSIAQ